MRARMFKPQFAELVKSGAKRQTIRPIPKRMPTIGDFESWRQWSGLPYRSKQTELAKVELISVEPVVITHRQIIIGNKSLSDTNGELKAFCQADGFSSFQELENWFETNHGLPFEGILIKSK